MKVHNGAVVLRNDGIDPVSLDEDLNAGINTFITVRVASLPVAGQGVKASLFDLNDIAITNPFVSDDNGNYTFKAASGIYDVIVDEGGSNIIHPSVDLEESSSIVKATAYDTVALMNSSEDIVAGDRVQTNGFHESLDGGGASYLAIPDIDYVGIPDGYGDQQGQNDLVLQKITGAVFNPKEYGTYNDLLQDDSLPLQAAYTAAVGSTIQYGNYSHLISVTIDISGVKSTIAYGATWTPTSNITMFKGTMYTSSWLGGFLDYRVLQAAGTIDENAIGIWFFKDDINDPGAQVQHSVIGDIQMRGNHTGIKMATGTGLTWQTEFRNVSMDLNAGVSTSKAIGYDIEADGGVGGGSTTLRFNKCSVQDFSAQPFGAGRKGWRIQNIAGVEFKQCSYDFGEVEGGDIMDIFANRILVEGFHTEGLTNVTVTGTTSPFKFNAATVETDGFVFLNSKATSDNAWICLRSNASLKLGHFYIRKALGETNAQYRLELFNAGIPTVMSVGNVARSAITGMLASSRVFFARDRADNVEGKVLITGQVIWTMDKGSYSSILMIRGDYNSDSRGCFTSMVTVARARNGLELWVNHLTTQSEDILPSGTFVISYTTNGDAVKFNITNTASSFTVRVEEIAGILPLV